MGRQIERTHLGALLMSLALVTACSDGSDRGEVDRLERLVHGRQDRHLVSATHECVECGAQLVAARDVNSVRLVLAGDCPVVVDLFLQVGITDHAKRYIRRANPRVQRPPPLREPAGETQLVAIGVVDVEVALAPRGISWLGLGPVAAAGRCC